MDLLCPPEWRAVPGVVHVVSVPLDGLMPGALEVLDDEERARAARFVFDRHRSRFIAAHACLRLLLGQYIGQAPGGLRFAVGARGKPRLLDGGTDVRFNLSHSGDLALIAVSVGIEVGVDIEQGRPDALLDLARRFFAPGEVAALEALPMAEQAGAFVRGWTRKEAFIKALGDGLSFPLDQFEVSLAPDAAGQLLLGCGSDLDATARWRLVSLAAPPGYAAALAGEGADWHVVQWTCLTNSMGKIQLRRDVCLEVE
jgi:4'-phosphopantetheinyl transferase